MTSENTATDECQDNHQDGVTDSSEPTAEPVPAPAPEQDEKDEKEPVLIIVMGVSGTGKSTLGQALADALDMPFVDGDDLHPESNVAKMSRGEPLTDADRAPWLELIRTTAEHMVAEQQREKPDAHAGVVVACSALKRVYRDLLRGTAEPSGRLPEHLEPPHPSKLPTWFVFLRGPREVLLDRMEKRKGHFMKVGMLDSQLKTLEDPEGEEGVVVVRLEDTTEEQVKQAIDKIR